MRDKTKFFSLLGAIVALTLLFILLGDVQRPLSVAERARVENAMRRDVPAVEMKGYVLRSLELEDYGRGFMACLNQMTVPVDITNLQFEERYCAMSMAGCYRVVVAYDPAENRIVGTGTLVVERKFIRGCVLKGHIEDVVVSADKRGLGIGKEIVQHLLRVSRALGCYKAALVCDATRMAFYEKCGLTEKEREMVVYHQ